MNWKQLLTFDYLFMDLGSQAHSSLAVHCVLTKSTERESYLLVPFSKALKFQGFAAAHPLAQH